MEPGKIRILLAAPEEKLDQAARRLQLPLPVAQKVRLQAMNLVLGKCALCGDQTPLGMCKGCFKNHAASRLVWWSGRELLTKLNPNDQLLSRTCASCKRSFTLHVNYLLQQFESGGRKLKKHCRYCSEKENSVRKPAPAVVPKAKKEVQPESKELEEQQRLERVARIEREKVRLAAVKAKRKKAEDLKKERLTQQKQELEQKRQGKDYWKEGEGERLSQNPFSNSDAVLKLNESLKKEAPKGGQAQTPAQ